MGDPIQRLLAVEQKARALLAQAEQDATGTVEAARRHAHDVVAEALQAARAEADEALGAAHERAEGERDESLKRAADEAPGIEEADPERVEAAVDMVVRVVTGEEDRVE